MPERSVIRELVTILGWDVDEKTISKFESRITSVKKNLRRMTIAAGIAGSALVGIAVKTARAGDSLAKTSKRLGINIKALQEWRFIAERSGLTIGQIDTAITMFGRNAGEAAQGIGEAKDAFGTLGVQMMDTSGNLREVDDLLAESLAALADEESQIKKLALAQKLFGRGGAPVIQMLADGSAGLEQIRTEYAKLGAVIDEETAKLSEEAVDGWLDFKTAINGVIFAMGKELLPIIIDLLKQLTAFIARNQALIRTIAWLTIGIVGLTGVVFGAIAAWGMWKLAILFVNKALLLTLAKVAAIIALFAIFALLAEDVALFFRGDAVTVTGRAVEGLKNAVKVAIDFWKNLIVQFITKTVPESLIGVLDRVMTYLGSLWTRFVEMIKSTLQAAIDAVIPPWLLDYLRRSAAGKFLGMDPGATEKARLGRAAQRLGGTMRARAQPGASVIANVTVNQAPGQTGPAVATAVAERLAGKGVTIPLIGLAP
jgi:hypothetical protein